MPNVRLSGAFQRACRKRKRETTGRKPAVTRPTRTDGYVRSCQRRGLLLPCITARMTTSASSIRKYTPKGKRFVMARCVALWTIGNIIGFSDSRSRTIMNSSKNSCPSPLLRSSTMPLQGLVQLPCEAERHSSYPLTDVCNGLLG
jgi:hypothetical protein